MKNKTFYSMMDRSEWQSLYNAIESETFKASLSLRKRLNHCQAFIYPAVVVDDVSYIPLVSYETLIGVYDKTNDFLISFGYFSSTSTQHWTKFKNLIRLEYRTNPAYRHSIYEGEMVYYLFRYKQGDFGDYRPRSYYY